MSTALDRLFEDAQTARVAPGQGLFLVGDPVRCVYRVISGEVVMLRRTPQGGTITLQRCRAGEMLAEASVWSSVYHCEAEAQTGAEVRAVPMALFRARMLADPALAAAWAHTLAAAVQAARMRAGILALDRVADRLEAWLACGNEVPPRGQIQTLAADLGVTREALYRTLARRRASASPPKDTARAAPKTGGPP